MSISNLDAGVQTTQHVIVNVDAAGQMNCVPMELTVVGPDVLIAFHLNGSGWEFPDNAAVVVGNPGGQFPLPSRTVNATLATLLDRNTAKNSYSYTVSVQNVVSGHRQTLDPTIKNTG